MPKLQYEGEMASFFRYHRGATFASSALMAPMTDAFVAAIKAYAEVNEIPLVRFVKGQRKDDVAAEYLARLNQEEGVLFIGVAQEKVRFFRTEKWRNPETGQSYLGLCVRRPWSTSTTSMPLTRTLALFLEFCSYFTYNGRLCINGHEYAKRQLSQRGIGYEALDNGFLTCEDLEQLQAICDGLGPAKIDSLVRKWLASCPSFHAGRPCSRLSL